MNTDRIIERMLNLSRKQGNKPAPALLEAATEPSKIAGVDAMLPELLIAFTGSCAVSSRSSRCRQ